MSPQDAVELIASQSGVDVRLVGQLASGEIGAYEVTFDGAHRGLLKYAEGAEAHAVSSSVAHALRLADNGYPVPDFVLIADANDAFITVQQWMPGATRERIDYALASEAVRLNRMQRGASPKPDDQEAWDQFISRALSEGLTDAEGFCLHYRLNEHGRSSRALLERVKRVGEATLPALKSDVVHCDFHHRNILRDGAAVSAVVDWTAHELAMPASTW